MTNAMQQGVAAAKARNPAEAARWFEQACQEDPDNALAKAWFGQSLCSLGRRVEGTTQLREAGERLLEAARSTGNTNPVIEIATQLQHWGEMFSALDLLKQTVTIKPQEFRGHQLLAAAYAQLNKKNEALSAGKEALKLNPDNAMMQVFLGSLEADAGEYAAARERLQGVLEKKPGAREAFRAHKELARILDKQADYGQVFSHLHAAGVCARALPEYSQQNIELIPNMLKASRATFDRQLMGRWADTTFPSDQPAPSFVVGFMRSGTTLTQEVLDAHLGAFVADEVDFVSAMKRELNLIVPAGDSIAQKLDRLDLHGVTRLRKFYWQRVRERFGETAIGDRVFVDKFTMNTVDLGLINCIFPDARVIFVMRDPRDVCLSCFMQLMVPTPATVQLLTWKRTAEFYAQVMDWWMYVRSNMTLKFRELRYEQLVEDFETTSRMVFDFLGLDWDPAVTRFHEHAATKFVATPSRSQVSRPLYASSVERWRLYEAEFSEVTDILAPYVAAFGYDSASDCTPSPVI